MQQGRKEGKMIFDYFTQETWEEKVYRTAKEMGIPLIYAGLLISYAH